jgi:ribonuclease R
MSEPVLAVVEPRGLRPIGEPEWLTPTDPRALAKLDEGTVVRGSLERGKLRIAKALALPGTARAKIYGVADELGLRPRFPDEVEQEVRRLEEEPGIDDETLVDWTDLPFVTIDGPTALDLDQAVHVERIGASFVIRYALADAAHFVPPQSALFAESMRRGASIYLPGFAVPMLPRALSEGLVSLNPRVDRRALVFVMRIDSRGRTLETQIERARIHSRAKLSFADVQSLYDDPKKSPLRGRDFERSLLDLRGAGEACLANAELRNVVAYRRREVETRFEGEGGLAFVATESVRDMIELYNEQISLLTNREGGRLLAESTSAHLQPIYRAHPGPDPAKLEALTHLSRAVAEAHGLDVPHWGYDLDHSLRTWLARLPTSGPHERVAKALERQAVMANVRSAYTTEPLEHVGVGAEVYARFSAPMRELVGVFVHKELLELVGELSPESPSSDLELRERVVASANRSRDLQRKANDLVGRLVIDELMGKGAERPLADRPVFTGTVMGITTSKLHVQLDEPPLDVKVYLRDLGRLRGGVFLAVERDGALLRDGKTKEVVTKMGDEVRVRVHERDTQWDRWVLALV